VVRKDFVLNPDISIGAKMLYIAIRSYCAPDADTAFPSSKTLAASLGINRETVFKYAQELERLGYLERAQQHSEGRFAHTLYTLHDTDPSSRKNPQTEKPAAEESDTKSTHKGEYIPSGECDAPSAEEVMEYWHSHPNLPRIRGMDETRRRHLRARRKEALWRENWKAAIDRVAKSSFCTGGGRDGWRIDIDFFLKPSTMTKILEGKYDDCVAPTKPKTLNYVP
jgi:DNA-binding transcriptional regulator YhcF (GntR family)